MKCLLINPHWTYDGSIYFGCREPHLPLEYGYAQKLLEAAGHEVLLHDGQLEGLTCGTLRQKAKVFSPDLTVVTTAPSYLFWRCPPPELRIPQETVSAVKEFTKAIVAIGPHGSVTPRAVLKKLDVDAVIMGEAEEVISRLAGTDRAAWHTISSLCLREGEEVRVQGAPHVADVAALPALSWPRRMIGKHRHHHHRFDAAPAGPGAEMEASRGCPYHCSFCARESFRGPFRKRPLATVLSELDGLLDHGIEYLYFIDELFMPDAALLSALKERPVKFGIQTRIDLWSPEMLDLLGEAGCVSIEAGVESITEKGRMRLNKSCRMSTEELTRLLLHAKRGVPFVQATLMDAHTDERGAIEQWRQHLRRFGVWANKPVPLFPYPGSAEYRKHWGAPDDRAWERAHDDYVHRNRVFSDIQDRQFLSLEELEVGGTR